VLKWLMRRLLRMWCKGVVGAVWYLRVREDAFGGSRHGMYSTLEAGRCAYAFAFLSEASGVQYGGRVRMGCICIYVGCM